MPFEATLFSPLSGDSAKVTVRAFGSTLEVIGAPVTLRVDPAKCALTAGGWDRESIQIAWPGEGGMWALTSKDKGARDELARIPHFQTALGEAVRAQTAARRSGRLGLTVVVVLTLLPVLLLAGLLVFRNQVVDWVLERIPVTVDQEVGKMFEGEILGSKEEIKDTEANRAIEAIVGRLNAASGEKRFEFTVSLQRNKEVNAFAAPGGLIVVYTGLIEKAGSAEEAAGVLAHEMAHASRRHSMRQLIYAGGVLPLMGLLIGQPDAAALFQNLGRLSELKFSRAQEEDADRTGFDTLVAANISPEGMARFFDRLAEDDGVAPSFLSTHPSSGDRAALIRTRAKALGDRILPLLPVDWNAAKASVRAESR
ncbi:MAG: M48 family metallopeptidase [Vicinamibacteria bacterium]|nr:M48 family metallopeptidase [Vicinamibacteria bacterium]